MSNEANGGGMSRVEAREHELKCWPQYFASVEDGSKPFELRRNDRDYRVGDTLRLREWRPHSKVYTGREVRKRVRYVLEGGAFGLEAGYVCMALDALPAPTPGETVEVQVLQIATHHDPGERTFDGQGISAPADVTTVLMSDGSIWRLWGHTPDALWCRLPALPTVTLAVTP